MWKIILYSSVMAGLLLLAFLSRREDLEIMEEENLSFFQRPFMRMAVWLHKKKNTNGKTACAASANMCASIRIKTKTTTVISAQ